MCAPIYAPRGVRIEQECREQYLRLIGLRPRRASVCRSRGRSVHNSLAARKWLYSGGGSKGTLISRPSSKATTNESSVNQTLVAIKSCSSFLAVEFIPFLQNQRLVLTNQISGLFKVRGFHCFAACQCHGLNPKLRGRSLILNVNMGRFIVLVRIKVKSETVFDQDGWQWVSLLLAGAILNVFYINNEQSTTPWMNG